ncbi:MAG: sulfotransferase [Planctomycetota bacterium]
MIVIGMHRSGTTLLCRLLDELGVFMGKRLDWNHESIFFKRLNEWLIRQSSGGREHAEPVRALLANDELCVLALDYWRRSILSPRLAGYLGAAGYLRHRKPARFVGPWGWKDPCNSYTAGLWRQLFPEAKIIHVRRHGVDVAASLESRNTWMFDKAKNKYERRRWLYAFRARRGGFANVRWADFDGGMDTWVEYVGAAEQQTEAAGKCGLSLRYEDLLARPHEVLADVVRFCGIKIEDDRLAQVSSMIRPSRAMAFVNDERLRRMARKYADVLARFGYTPDNESADPPA